jgi:hypothetical protein
MVAEAVRDLAFEIIESRLAVLRVGTRMATKVIVAIDGRETRAALGEKVGLDVGVPAKGVEHAKFASDLNQAITELPDERRPGRFFGGL